MNKKLESVIFIILILMCAFLVVLSLLMIVDPASYCDSVYQQPSTVAFGICLLIVAVAIFVPCFILLVPSVREVNKNVKSSVKKSTKYRLKCYKEIDRIHKYYENGSMTLDEFDQLKKEILNKIDNFPETENASETESPAL